MIRTIARLITGMALASSLAATATAATTICGPRDALLSALTDRLREQRESIGLTGNGMLMELYVSEAGEWSIMLTSPGGASCIIAAGDNWERVPRPIPET